VLEAASEAVPFQLFGTPPPLLSALQSIAGAGGGGAPSRSLPGTFSQPSRSLPLGADRAGVGALLVERLAHDARAAHGQGMELRGSLTPLHLAAAVGDAAAAQAFLRAGYSPFAPTRLTPDAETGPCIPST